MNLNLFNEMQDAMARREADIRKLRTALEAIAEMAENRSRVNMPNGVSLALFARCALIQ